MSLLLIIMPPSNHKHRITGISLFHNQLWTIKCLRWAQLRKKPQGKGLIHLISFREGLQRYARRTGTTRGLALARIYEPRFIRPIARHNYLFSAPRAANRCTRRCPADNRVTIYQRGVTHWQQDRKISRGLASRTITRPSSLRRYPRNLDRCKFETRQYILYR